VIEKEEKDETEGNRMRKREKRKEVRKKN